MNKMNFPNNQGNMPMNNQMNMGINNMQMNQMNPNFAMNNQMQNQQMGNQGQMQMNNQVPNPQMINQGNQNQNMGFNNMGQNNQNMINNQMMNQNMNQNNQGVNHNNPGNNMQSNNQANMVNQPQGSNYNRTQYKIGEEQSIRPIIEQNSNLIDRNELNEINNIVQQMYSYKATNKQDNQFLSDLISKKIKHKIHGEWFVFISDKDQKIPFGFSSVNQTDYLIMTLGKTQFQIVKLK